MTPAQSIKTVAAKHKLQPHDIFGHDRFQHFVDARIEIIGELRKAEVNATQIANAMERDRTTIIYHIDPEFARRKRARRGKQAGREKAQVNIRPDLMAELRKYAALTDASVEAAVNDMLRQQLETV